MFCNCFFYIFFGGIIIGQGGYSSFKKKQQLLCWMILFEHIVQYYCTFQCYSYFTSYWPCKSFFHLLREGMDFCLINDCGIIDVRSFQQAYIQTPPLESFLLHICRIQICGFVMWKILVERSINK